MQLEFNTDIFCMQFKITNPESLYESIMEDGWVPAPSDEDIEEILIDFDIEDTTENRDAVSSCIVYATESELARSFYAQWQDFIGFLLEPFSDYKYEYFVEGESKYYSGVAKGIENIEADFESIRITVNPDFRHIINDCLAGYGMFDPTDTEEEMSVEDMEGTFFNIRYYWEIYGVRKPSVEYSDRGFKYNLYRKELEGFLKEEGLI